MTAPLYTGYGTAALSLPPRLDRPDIQSVEEVVTNALREAILTGELRPGDRLLQEQLAEQLRVSRIPLRDALRRLEAEGLVRIARRGAEVASLTAADVKEIYDLRISLETELMEAAIAALTPDDVTKLIEMSEHMDNRVEEPAAASKARRSFYGELYRHAGRPRTYRIVLALRDDVQRYHVLNDIEVALHDHAELRECIRAKDAKRGATLLREHLRRACADLLEVLQKEAKA